MNSLVMQQKISYRTDYRKTSCRTVPVEKLIKCVVFVEVFTGQAEKMLCQLS